MLPIIHEGQKRRGAEDIKKASDEDCIFDAG